MSYLCIIFICCFIFFLQIYLVGVLVGYHIKVPVRLRAKPYIWNFLSLTNVKIHATYLLFFLCRCCLSFSIDLIDFHLFCSKKTSTKVSRCCWLTHQFNLLKVPVRLRAKPYILNFLSLNKINRSQDKCYLIVVLSLFTFLLQCVKSNN